MTEEPDIQWRILRELQEISGKMDTMIFLSKMGQEKEVAILKKQILGRSNIRRKIYELCDGELTINEIAKKINQKLPNVSTEINYLVESGVITIKKMGSKKYPQRTKLIE